MFPIKALSPLGFRVFGFRAERLLAGLTAGHGGLHLGLLGLLDLTALKTATTSPA